MGNKIIMWCHKCKNNTGIKNKKEHLKCKNFNDVNYENGKGYDVYCLNYKNKEQKNGNKRTED